MCAKSGLSKHFHVPNITLNCTPIRLVTKEKYLGFIFTDDGMDNDHIKREIRNTYARGSMLIRNFKHCSDDVKVRLYKAYCSSVYCCGLLSSHYNYVLKKLHVAFNKVFKCLMNVHGRYSASALFVSFNVCNFLVLRRKLVYSLSCRVSASMNSFIADIRDSAHFENCQLKKEWNNIMFL